jgi:hypothetical protein
MVPATPHASAPHRVIGLLVHAALAQWRLPDAGFERWAVARARSYGLTDAGQLHDAARRTRWRLERLAVHPLYREMDAADERLHEVPYQIMVDGRFENRRIDALYRCGDVWTVVEFKTDRLRNAADFDQLLEREDYVAQAGRYAAAVEQLVGRRPRVVLCLLDYAGRVRLWPDTG